MTFHINTQYTNTAVAVFEAMERDFETMEFGPTVIESDPWVALDPKHHFTLPADPVASLLDSDEARTELVVSHHAPR